MFKIFRYFELLQATDLFQVILSLKDDKHKNDTLNQFHFSVCFA